MGEPEDIRKRVARSPWEDEKFSEKSLEHIDKSFLSGTSQEVDFMEKELGLKPGDLILDAGCGAGRHSIEFALRGYRVVGIDISSHLLKIANERAARAGVNVRFIKGNVLNLADLIKDTVFDGAISICESGLGVLGGWKNDLKFLTAIKELLKPGGKFILTTYNGLRRYRKWKEGDTRFDFVNGIQFWETPPEWEGDKLVEMQRMYIPSELKMLFELAGFSGVEIKGCSPGNFHGQPLKIEDIELMVIAIR